MRVRMACTLSVILASTCASLPVEAQVKPAAAQFPKAPPDRTPTAPKFSEGPKRTEKGSDLPLYNLVREAQENTLQLREELPKLSPGDAAAGPPASCAHILIYEAPPTDSKMIIEAPKDYSEPEPIYQGLPPCSGDFRPRFFLTRVPAPKLMKPARTDSSPPGSDKHSSSVRPE